MKHGIDRYMAVGMVLLLVFSLRANADNPWNSFGKGPRGISIGSMSHGSGRGIGIGSASRSLGSAWGRSSSSNLFGGGGRRGGPRIEIGVPAREGGIDISQMFRGMGRHVNYNRYSRPRDYGYGYRYHDPMASAYRDVGMAHALVGLLGIVVQATQPAPCVTAVPAAPVAVSAVPAPAPAISGHWERRAVVVQERRQEQYQEWVPEVYDPQTGAKISGGYYEIRTRLIPEIVQYRDVWATP